MTVFAICVVLFIFAAMFDLLMRVANSMYNCVD